MNKKVALIGASSSLCKEVASSLEGKKINITKFSRGKNGEGYVEFDATNLNKNYIASIFVDDFDYYVFSLGKLIPNNILEQSEEEIIESLKVNCLFIIKCSEFILKKNKFAKIIIIGSESGRKGSYDTTYFLSKAMLRAYVRQRGVQEKQQLLLLSPSTIQDSNMTQNRTDIDILNTHKNNHPKKRFLDMKEVVDVIVFLITTEMEYLTNTEIELNGGKFCRMR